MCICVCKNLHIYILKIPKHLDICISIVIMCAFKLFRDSYKSLDTTQGRKALSM